MRIKADNNKQHLLCCSLIFVFIFTACSQQQSYTSTYEKLLEFSDGLKVINTHEHQHRPDEYNLDTLNFYHLLQRTYLMADINSAGAKGIDFDELSQLSPEEQWNTLGPFLDYTRNSSYYDHFVMGFKKLYGFDDIYFTQANIAALSSRVEQNYSNYELWFDSAFQKAGFEIMFNDQYWNPFNVDIDTQHFALVFHINAIVYDVCNRPAEGEAPRGAYEYAAKDGIGIQTLDDYLNYCDFLFQLNLSKNAVCVKNSMAYGRSLYYEEVSYETAERLYLKPAYSLSPAERKQLEDFMFHWVIKKSIEYDLPIQIHTGYLAGNGNYLENSDPLKLTNLFMEYRDAKFVLFHGGYPWTSQFVALGKMFPNVYLDLVWLPQICRSKAIITLDEILDCVPYNKVFWGGDCSFIEESTGSLELAKRVIAETLALRIEEGLLTEDLAYDIISSIFRENAIEVFKLDYE
ncbi:MAG: amidohydrolase family protein [Bacteroidota bacterium]|nr:amidohydrolase family protein [Bacteroidota bacterium]